MSLLQVPRHVAIIPDGNRRWAKSQGLKVSEGHERGAEQMREVALYAAERGVEVLSMWGMSMDNFTKRSASEVGALLRIYRKEFLRLAQEKEVHERQVKIQVIGRWSEMFPRPVRSAVEGAIVATKQYSKHVLNFMLAYNGTDEMLSAIKELVRRGREDAGFEVTEEALKQQLFTRGLPPVDLMIRTAGEPHNSAGFMMWDVADAQLYFTDTFWPAFGKSEFDAALEEYSARERRLGK